MDLRDDKSYPYIEVTGDAFPRIWVVRPNQKNPASRYYGPYINPRLIREALTIIRKIFPFCTCGPFPAAPCLDYHIGLCPAPCAGQISRRDYARVVRQVCLILEGKKDALFRQLQRDMERLSRGQDFEGAARVRDQIRALGALYSGTTDMQFL